MILYHCRITPFIAAATKTIPPTISINGKKSTSPPSTRTPKRISTITSAATKIRAPRARNVVKNAILPLPNFYAPVINHNQAPSGIKDKGDDPLTFC